MASIPLPALHLNPPPQQENPLESLSRIMALKQQLAMAPLQQQQAQQQVQSGQLDLQQKQIQMKDAQAMNQAMMQWSQQPAKAAGSAGGSAPPMSSMPNYDDLIDLAKKNGASFQAIQGLQSHVLDMKAKAATIAKDDAQTGQDNASALKTKNGMLIDAMSGVMNLPDEQLAPGLMSAAQELAQKGILDPQHMQAAQQLAQSGDPNYIRQHLTATIAGMGGFSKLLEDAQKQAAAKKETAESDWYAQNGGAPGVPAEMMQQADWLKKNPGKGPSDYKLWVMKNSPTAMVMTNQLGGQRNDDALNFAADNYRQTGQMPAGYTRSPQTTTAIIQRAAQLDKEAGGQGVAVNKTILNANKVSLDALQKNFDTVSAFENTANKNIEMLKGIAAKVPDLGVRFANVPVRMISGTMIGSENMAAFKTALAPVQAESAKILNSASLSGQLSDSSRHELQDIVDGNLPYKSLVASLNVLQQDFKNRHSSMQEQIRDIQNRLKGGNQDSMQPDAGRNQGGSTAPIKITLPSGKQISIE